MDWGLHIALVSQGRSQRIEIPVKILFEICRKRQVENEFDGVIQLVLTWRGQFVSSGNCVNDLGGLLSLESFCKLKTSGALDNTLFREYDRSQLPFISNLPPNNF